MATYLMATSETWTLRVFLPAPRRTVKPVRSRLPASESPSSSSPSRKWTVTFRVSLRLLAYDDGRANGSPVVHPDGDVGGHVDAAVGATRTGGAVGRGAELGPPVGVVEARAVVVEPEHVLDDGVRVPVGRAPRERRMHSTGVVLAQHREGPDVGRQLGAAGCHQTLLDQGTVLERAHLLAGGGDINGLCGHASGHRGRQPGGGRAAGAAGAGPC